MKTIAIIPSKGTSIRIPRKNLVDVGGKPLVQWTLEAAQDIFDDVVVSTDDHEVALLGKNFNAKIVMHPEGDPGATKVVLDVLENKVNKNLYDSVFMLQPTSPFRSQKSIKKAMAELKDLKEQNPLTVFGVMEANKRCTYHDIGTTFRKRHFLVPQFTDAPENSPLSYRVNGAIFGTSINNLLNRRSFVKDIWSVPILMDQIESIEVDNADDLALARAVAMGLKRNARNNRRLENSS